MGKRQGAISVLKLFKQNRKKIIYSMYKGVLYFWVRRIREESWGHLLSNSWLKKLKCDQVLDSKSVTVFFFEVILGLVLFPKCLFQFYLFKSALFFYVRNCFPTSMILSWHTVASYSKYSRPGFGNSCLSRSNPSNLLPSWVLSLLISHTILYCTISLHWNHIIKKKHF